MEISQSTACDLTKASGEKEEFSIFKFRLFSVVLGYFAILGCYVVSGRAEWRKCVECTLDTRYTKRRIDFGLLDAALIRANPITLDPQ